jgi:hypothetical protein
MKQYMEKNLSVNYFTGWGQLWDSLNRKMLNTLEKVSGRFKAVLVAADL